MPVRLAISLANKSGAMKKLYEGNIYEAHTLLSTIEALSTSTNSEKPLIVTDSGIAIEENLSMLKEKGYDYLFMCNKN